MKYHLAGCHWVLLSLVGVTFAAGQTAAQTTVQLPTLQRTGVSTTVLVPDGGAAYLGGINRSSAGRNSYGSGLPGLGNRGYGRTSSAGGFWVSTTIIDHHEIDQALLAEAARRRGAKYDVQGRPVSKAPRVSPRTRAPVVRRPRSYLPKNLSQNIRGGSAY